MNLKPLVEIKDAHIVGDRLYGVPVNHPSPYVSNTTVVVTSPIIKNDGENVETQNTMYEVLNWYDPTQPYREGVRPARDSHWAGDE